MQLLHHLFAVDFEIKLVTEADLQISGDAIKDPKIYTQDDKFLNKTFEHTYQVSKILSSPVTGVLLEVGCICEGEKVKVWYVT